MNKLYPFLGERVSTRSFLNEFLSNDDLNLILSFQENLTALVDSPCKFRIVSNHNVKGYKKKIAKQYLLVYSNDDNISQINAAFMAHQIVLFMTGIGIMTCYNSHVKPSFKTSNKADKFLIAIALGYPKRAVSHGHKRKALTELTNDYSNYNFYKALSLAPSFNNYQPFYFKKVDDSLQMWVKPYRSLSGRFLKEMLSVDIGIMLCHLAIATFSDKKDFQFYFNDGEYKTVGNNYCIGFLKLDGGNYYD